MKELVAEEILPGKIRFIDRNAMDHHGLAEPRKVFFSSILGPTKENGDSVIRAESLTLISTEFGKTLFTPVLFYYRYIIYYPILFTTPTFLLPENFYYPYY